MVGITLKARVPFAVFYQGLCVGEYLADFGGGAFGSVYELFEGFGDWVVCW
jgi:hypothetical protein